MMKKPKREFVRHEIVVRFAAGPHDGERAGTDKLDDVKLFIDEPARTVQCYMHEGDGLYLWRPALSLVMTEKFDEVLERWGQHATQRMVPA
jgi:hypothetical protein